MNKLTPENDTQELWALSGKVEAVLIYIKTATYVDKEIIVAMLEGDASGLPMHKNKQRV